MRAETAVAALARPQPEIDVAQDRALGRMLALCARGHPHYRRRVVAATSAAVGARPMVELAEANGIFDPARQPTAVRLVDAR